MGGWHHTYLTTDEDRLWHDEGLRNGWWLPEMAPAWMRLWGLRHLRGWWRISCAHRDFRNNEHATGSWDQLWHREWVAYAVLRGWV